MKKILSLIKEDSQGVALLMVIGFITLLTALLVDFSFETRINSSKAYNSQDRVQARLNAESGLNFALGKLKIYQIARNRIEKDEKAKGVITPSLLESTIIAPFIYPLVAPEKAGLIQKNALKEFEDKTFLQGQFQLFITPVKGFLNPNSLRIPLTPPKESDDDQSSTSDPDSSTKKQPHQYIEEQLINLIQNILNDFKENNDPFLKEYPNIEPRMLVKELKFYVNDPESMHLMRKVN